MYSVRLTHSHNKGRRLAEELPQETDRQRFTLQNLPSSERHIPSNPQRRVGEVGTTAGHHSTTRNFV